MERRSHQQMFFQVFCSGTFWSMIAIEFIERLKTHPLLKLSEVTAIEPRSALKKVPLQKCKTESSRLEIFGGKIMNARPKSVGRFFPLIYDRAEVALVWGNYWCRFAEWARHFFAFISWKVVGIFGPLPYMVRERAGICKSEFPIFFRFNSFHSFSSRQN